MTPLTIRRITNLRAAGWGYKSIAAFCGLTRDQVRSCCLRYELTQGSPECKRVCAWCGRALEGRTGRARFCTPTCRWASWQHKQNERGQRQATCLGCGNAFSRIKQSQKYCSHACYVRTRFGTRGGRR